MTKELVISSNRHETKLAILEDGQLVEVYFQRTNEYSLVGSIHKGRVTRVLPGMQSAFVNLGLERDAFLYVSDFFEETGEEYDKLSGEERLERRPREGREGRGGRGRDGRDYRGGREGRGGDGRDARDASGRPEGESAPAPVEGSQEQFRAEAGRSFEGRPEGRGDGRGRRSRRRRRGRGLPDSKYAAAGAGGSSAPEPAPGAFDASSESELEPLVLPGESLAKYRGQESAPGDDESGVSLAGSGDVSAIAESDKDRVEALSEDEVTEAIEEAVEARLEEIGPVGDFDIQEAVEAGVEPLSTNADSGDDSGAAMEAVADDEESGAAEAGSEPEQGDASAELREDQPVARYIAPRSRRGRRRGRGDRGDREQRVDNRDREARVAEARTETRLDARQETETAPRPERPPMPSIADLLKEGQEIIVQIAKEPLGQKGARITSHVAIPGRYVVFMPTLDHHGVSRKVGTEDERHRLKRILQTHGQGMTGGFIIRTAGEGKAEADIAADMTYLHNLWLDIRKKAEKRPAPTLLHHDLELVQRTLRDQVSDQFKSIWVDNEETFESVVTFLERFQAALVPRVKLYSRDAPIFDAFNITSELEKALRPKVWLKSGGFIVINQTEALVAIDVNTGKYVGKTHRLEDTIVKTNTEAVKEIARQIRLRDLGGIIVVDFIDMDERRNRQKVMQALEEAMRADRAPYKILQFNDFGLVAITRRRVKQSLERALCMPCPTCEGAGYVKSVETVVAEILTEANKIKDSLEGKNVTLRVNPDVGQVLKSNQHHFLEELEEILGRPVLVTGDPMLHPEKFDLA
jgi:ribonuclease G